MTKQTLLERVALSFLILGVTERISVTLSLPHSRVGLEFSLGNIVGFNVYYEGGILFSIRFFGETCFFCIRDKPTDGRRGGEIFQTFDLSNPLINHLNNFRRVNNTLPHLRPEFFRILALRFGSEMEMSSHERMDSITSWTPSDLDSSFPILEGTNFSFRSFTEELEDVDIHSYPTNFENRKDPVLQNLREMDIWSPVRYQEVRKKGTKFAPA